jgi:hypothetical protein
VPVRMVADATFGEVTMTLTERELGAASCAPHDLAASEPLAVQPREPASKVGKAWRTPDTFSAAERTTRH